MSYIYTLVGLFVLILLLVSSSVSSGLLGDIDVGVSGSSGSISDWSTDGINYSAKSSFQHQHH